MSNFESIAGVLSGPSWDIIALLVFLAAGVFYGLTTGRSRLVAVLFALYIGALLFENLAFVETFIRGKGLLEIFLWRVGTFAALVLLLSFLFSKFVFPYRPESGRLWQILLLSFLEVGFFASFAFRLLPSVELFVFSPVARFLFASPGAFFWWLVLPLPALFLIMRRT